MQMELSYKGDTIINYTPAEKHWWITGFNSNVLEVEADDLFAVYRVDFTNNGMYYAFKNSFKGNYGNWLLFDSSTLAIFFFD